MDKKNSTGTCCQIVFIFIIIVAVIVFFLTPSTSQLTKVNSSQNKDDKVNSSKNKVKVNASQNEEKSPETQKGVPATANLPDVTNRKIAKLLRDYDRKFNNKYITGADLRGVHYTGKTGVAASGRQLTCAFKERHRLVTLNKMTTPYREMGLAKHFPSDSGFETLEGRFNNCAVVGSSVYMKGSTLGAEIDSHDAVLRFNIAPTEGFENDVGTKTTVRLINSQVLEDRNVEEFETRIGNETLFLWKAGPYNGNLYRWYLEPEAKNFFSDYILWVRRHPQNRPHMIHPGSLWRAWDLVQEHSVSSITKTPPTSGFTGILIMLSLCQKIDVYGYITPDNSDCHYFPMTYPCAPLSWHPVSFEKAIIARMSEGVPQDPRAEEKGLVTLIGYHAITC